MTKNRRTKLIHFKSATGLTVENTAMLVRSVPATALAAWRASWPLSAYVVFAAGLTAILPALIVMLEGRRPSYVLSDPAWVAAEEPYIGLVSNLGLMLWTCAATFCLVDAWTEKRMERRSDGFQFAVAAACLTLMFLVDDLIQFHEALVPRIHPNGEKLVVALYAVCIAAFALRFKERLSSEPVFSVIAGMCLALSAVSDLVLTGLFERLGLPEVLARGTHSFEDVLKFVGIAAWTSFCAIYLANRLRPYLDGQ